MSFLDHFHRENIRKRFTSLSSRSGEKCRIFDSSRLRGQDCTAPPGLEGRNPRNPSRHGLSTAFPLESWTPGSAARIVPRLRISALLEILMRVPGSWFQVPFSFSNYLFCLLCKLLWTRGWSAGRTVLFSGAPHLFERATQERE